MYTCRICGLKYEVRQCLAGHYTKHRQHTKRPRIDVIKQCKLCNTSFKVIRVLSGVIPKRESQYCSRACAAKASHTPEMREEFLKNRCTGILFKIPRINIICVQCRQTFKGKPGRMCCSSKCGRLYSGKIGGRHSAQKRVLRSKNEIYFSELCKSKFNNIECNTPIFNGWDADVIIHDIKVAVLWNGIWHYKKITKKHSLEQVQNRDKIKCQEIYKYGYTPYIVKDMGRYDKLFVEDIFSKFLAGYCNGNREVS